MTEYKLVGTATKNAYADDRLSNGAPGETGLLRTEYRRALKIGADADGLYKYADFLPFWDRLEGSAAPVTYKSRGLAQRLDIERLYVCFNGWWPEIGAKMRTASFKETEAYSVLSRFPKDRNLTLVVASAGNTARAFVRAASENGISLTVTVPEANAGDVWLTRPLAENVHIIPVPGDYLDAIAYADMLCKRDGYVSEGGAKNVARRDGMGTTVLSAYELTGDLADNYFQAVGSGTGGIAAHEAALRLAGFGLTKTRKMRLHLAQNTPFTPMTNAWRAHLSELLPQNEADAKRDIEAVSGKVLTNRKPPYSIRGGVFDALAESDGEMYAVTNAEISAAQALFQECEGAEICPEAGAALAALIQARADGRLNPDESVLLNITGGGLGRARAVADGSGN